MYVPHIYDQIVNIFWSLEAKKFGIPIPEICLLLGKIYTMVFLLRVRHEDSDRSYGGNGQYPLHGICQGNISVMDLCLVFFSLIVTYLKQEGKGVNTNTKITRISKKPAVLVFVDYTNTLSDSSK